MLAAGLQTQCEHKMDNLEDKRVLIVGLGKTGLSCARYLCARGVEVAVTDSRAHPPALDELQAAYPDIAVFVGGFEPEAFSRADCLIVSPGISLREPLIAEARVRGVEVIGDIELFARNANAPVVAITGSNGKTTVTTLLGQMARAAGMDVRVGGNIGTPALDLLHEPKPDLYVLELSSFQLETTEHLDAVAAAILNISEDHMDRYQNINDYSAAKAKVYHGSGTLVVNLDDDKVTQIVSRFRQGRAMTGFTLNTPEPGQFGVCRKKDESGLCYGNDLLLPLDDIRIKGRHNIANILAALALGHAAGVPLDAALQAVRDFGGLPHRCQWIAEQQGVNWYNDSKATNVGATLAALNGIDADNIILIAGGQGKGQDFSPLKPIIAQRVKHLFLLGEDAPLLQQSFDGLTGITCVDSLQQAVKQADAMAATGDVILLSPACASFDMFSGYEQRGEQFIAAVMEVVQ